MFSAIEFSELADSALDKGKELLSTVTEQLAGFDYSQLIRPEFLTFWGGVVGIFSYLLIKKVIGFLGAIILITAFAGTTILSLNT